jgi:hypothetical protein
LQGAHSLDFDLVLFRVTVALSLQSQCGPRSHPAVISIHPMEEPASLAHAAACLEEWEECKWALVMTHPTDVHRTSADLAADSRRDPPATAREGSGRRRVVGRVVHVSTDRLTPLTLPTVAARCCERICSRALVVPDHTRWCR